MFQLLLPARLHDFIMARLGDDGFRARSPERDAETSSLRIGSVVTAIESALSAAESEQSGLSRRRNPPRLRRECNLRCCALDVEHPSHVRNRRVEASATRATARRLA